MEQSRAISLDERVCVCALGCCDAMQCHASHSSIKTTSCQGERMDGCWLQPVWYYLVHPRHSAYYELSGVWENGAGTTTSTANSNLTVLDKCREKESFLVWRSQTGTVYGISRSIHENPRQEWEQTHVKCTRYICVSCFTIIRTEMCAFSKISPNDCTR